MAFNNFNNQQQMFPPQNQGNFGQLPVSGQQMGAFQPNQSYGVQGFAPQQGQQFPGYQMGAAMGPQMGGPMGPPPMNPQMRPQMSHQMRAQMGPQMAPQMGSQMGVQIGAFPSNVHLGHQFPKQQQIRIDQQRKQAEENMKKQEELMRKKQLEAKQRKLQQSFSAKKATSTDGLDSLFGKNKKAGSSSMTDLIGPLGKETAPKSTATKPTSVFSRPGGSVSHHSNLTPGQWGSGFMTSGSITSQGSPVSGLSSQQTGDMDDFGDFSQGPSCPGLGGNDGVFSVFQEATQPTGQFGGGSFAAADSSAMPTSGGGSVFSQAQAWHGSNIEQSRNIPAAGKSTVPQHSSFPPTQNMLTAPSIHGAPTASGDNMANFGTPTSVSWVGPSNITSGSQMTHFAEDSSRHRAGSIPSVPPYQGGQMAQFAGDSPRTRTSSIPEMMPNVASNVPNTGAMLQPGISHNQVNMGNQGGNFQMCIPPATGSLHQPSTMGPHGGGFGPEPSHPGAVPVPSNEEPSRQLGPDRSTMPATPTDTTQEQVPELEDSPERKLELLYGVTLPDWCVHGTDLPGIYKEIAEKTTDACDAIDTNRLFPILMASNLPRDQLGHIWNRANRAVPGQLNLLELRIVLGLVALGQAGLKTERLTLEKLATCKAAPIPSIPEDVLLTKGRGWSFSEQSHEGSQSSGMTEGSASRGRVGSASSVQSIDPNDKYSVFRAVDQPEVSSIAEATPSMDQNARFGAFQSGDGSAMKTEPPPGEVALFQGGVSQQSTEWNKPEVSSTGGHFQSPANQSFIPNKHDGSGDFQGQAGFLNKQIPGSFSVAQKWTQDDFGDFQSKATPYSGSIVTDIKQKSNPSKEADFGNFEAGISETKSGFHPLSVSERPQEDDFGDFQSGKESDSGSLDAASITNTKQQQLPQTTGQRLGNFQIGGERQTKAKTSEFAGINLFPNNNSSATKSITNIDSNRMTETDDFGDFQHSPGPSATTSDSSTSFSSGSSEKLASSLEKFKLPSHSLLSSQGGVKIPSPPGNKSVTNEKDSGDKKTQDSKTNPSNFASFPAELGNDPSQTGSTAKRSEDIYSALREADIGSGGGLFSVQKPVTTKEDLAADDDFADFGRFEVAGQSNSGEDIDFGAFKATDNLQNVSFGMFSDSSQAQLPAPSSSKGRMKDHGQDFADFNSFDSTHLSNPQPKVESGGEFGAFGSFVTGPGSAISSHQHSTTASDSLINSVSLEPTERYKVLSNDSADMDQHANAWSRCLNSCLLTLATATLAIQKMGEQSVKDEVLNSKEGATYFSAIVEIYRVTLRIRASIIKSAPNNTKLKDIHQEIESTWKNIANFLSGSTILPSQTSLDFTTHHVSATEDGSVACGICLLNVNKSTLGASKQADGKLMYGGRQYHSTCANFWCNRVDSVLPSLLPIDSLI